MGSDLAIRVEGLGKEYCLGLTHDRTLRDALHRLGGRLFRRAPVPGRVLPTADCFPEAAPQSTIPAAANGSDKFWALRDVSFEVQRGEVLGIIGRNGAGKSTLLKILSRVTKPTTGRAEIYGRVGSLLEVGTGFHPELTGRENIYLNGAILGMTKREIDRKFDEIVHFAGVRKFIDTPVKRYSSGMHVRLGFAVAAHLEPEILIVDEVLAVGDADFQKRCIGKMQDVSSHGRTVLIVSHNMGMITSLCPAAMLLDQGQLVTSGSSSPVVQKYLGRQGHGAAAVDFLRDGRRIGDELATLRRAWIEDQHENPINEIDIREPFKIKMEYELHAARPEPPHHNVHVLDQRGEYVFVSVENCASGRVLPGIYLAECNVPGNLLNDGCYFVGLAVAFTDQGVHISFHEKDALCITVRDPVLETVHTLRGGYVGPIPGPVRPRLDWQVVKVG